MLEMIARTGAQSSVRPGIATRDAGLTGRPIPYEDGLAMQREASDAILAESSRGTLLLLEHDPVYTAGRRALPEEYPSDGTPVVPVDRGGKVTWHGPGQLVAYPVIRLRERFGVVDFVRALEEAIIDVAAEFGATGFRVAGRSGVWADTGEAAPAKFAQIGLHTSAGIVTHGLAINCSNALDPFAAFIPCGITDAGVTTLSRLVGTEIATRQVAPRLAERLAAVFAEVAE